MFCQSCGKEIPGSAEFCQHCGKPAPAQESSVPAAAAPLPPYAGFWLRFLAVVIDFILYGTVAAAVLFLTVYLLVEEDVGSGPEEAVAVIIGVTVLLGLSLYLGWFLYFAILESSKWQASAGKKIVGIYVTDIHGNRLSFGRAAGRSFGAMVSHMTFYFGNIMAGFTQRKQALHDLIADCLVLRSR